MGIDGLMSAVKRKEGKKGKGRREDGSKRAIAERTTTVAKEREKVGCKKRKGYREKAKGREEEDP